jgi:tetrahydromethanopterin S-methyltransferase subunit G
VNDLEKKFAEIEKRVTALAAENRGLKIRVSELEGELSRALIEARDLDEAHAKQTRIREKVEYILAALENAGGKKTTAEAEEASPAVSP